MRRGLLSLVVLSGLLAGCGGAASETGAVPASASLAPANAVAFVTLVTDERSDQWQRAEQLLDLFPGARASLLKSVEDALATEEMTWREDIAPAIGEEVVVVVTSERQPIVLTRPESEAKLESLLAIAGERSIHAETASGWTAIAQEQSHLDAYTTAVGRGTLETDAGFTTAMEELPSDALARVWVDAAALTNDLEALVEESGTKVDIGIESISAAVSAETDGILLALAFAGADGLGTSAYEPRLFAQVPDDAVAALSFGGTQGILDRIQGSVDVDAISGQLEDTIGVSLEGIVDALSGEGVLYLRDGGDSVPEVTLVLAPPDAKDAFMTIDRIARRGAEEADGTIRSTTEDGVEATVVELGDLSLHYAMLDDDTVIVTTGGTAIRTFRATGSKLVDSSGFEQAAERVELGERTRGFVYVDIDGLVPFVEGLVGAESIPSDAREILGKLDSFILQTDGDGDVTRASGFVRVNGS